MLRTLALGLSILVGVTFQTSAAAEKKVALPSTPIAPLSASSAINLTLPKILYAVPGIETNLYFDNIILTTNTANFAFDITCSKGRQFAEKWSFTPKAEDVGDYPISLSVYNEANAVVASGSFMLRITSLEAKADLHMLMVGDSLTSQSVYVQQVVENCMNDDAMNVTMIGSHEPKGKESPVRHEGYGGWTAGTFVTRFMDTPYLNGRRQCSPFMYKNDAGKPALDFPRYCSEFNHGKAPDVVTLFLGCNDIFGADESRKEKAIETSLKNFDILIKMIKDYSPDTVIGLLLLAPPAATQDAFGYNYACGQTRWQYRRNQHRMVQVMIERYGNRNADKIHVVPIFAIVDADHGFRFRSPKANSRCDLKIRRLSNGVHPSSSGYSQIGDAVYCWLKSLAAKK